MMSSIQAGDVVVCVDDGARPGNKPLQLRALQNLSARRVYRVSEVGTTPKSRQVFVRLAGVETPENSDGFRIGYNPDRFRKVQKADDSFIAQIKACRPKQRDRVSS